MSPTFPSPALTLTARVSDLMLSTKWTTFYVTKSINSMIFPDETGERAKQREGGTYKKMTYLFA